MVSRMTLLLLRVIKVSENSHNDSRQEEFQDLNPVNSPMEGMFLDWLCQDIYSFCSFDYIWMGKFAVVNWWCHHGEAFRWSLWPLLDLHSGVKS